MAAVNPLAPPAGSAPSEMDRALAQWLAEGRMRLGQAAILPADDGAAVLCHADDAGRPDLAETADAVEIAREDDFLRFRPLKGAANLRHGWRLRAADLSSLRRALDAIYPGRLGAFLRFTQGRLTVTPLRETLARQTGMYRVTARLSDLQAAEVKRRLCSGCLRQILWEGDAPRNEPGAIPLLCQEACNLFVAEARAVIKGAS